jgi:hypothetical protein
MIAYEVRDVAGKLRAIHERHDDPDGKRFVWRRPDGRAGLNGTKTADLPLYGSERIGDALTVVVVEGEKAADALRPFLPPGFAVVGTVCGAAPTPGADALAVLAGRAVLLWPDNDYDDAGRRHMERIAAALAGLAVVAFVDWPDAPPKGDAADYVVGRTAGDVRALLSAAIPVLPARATTTSGKGIDAADLVALDLPPLRWIIPGLIPEGTTIIAAPPKVGKSCLVYQIATEVALGGELLGRRAASGSSLYLALEDGQRRGRERLLAALDGRTMPRGRLRVEWSAPLIGKGLEDALERWLDEHPDAAFVAIDTLGKVRPHAERGRNAYDVDVENLAGLQAIFRDRPTGLALVHHLRKEKSSDDFLASVSGTYGITGSADTIVAIRRKRSDSFATLVVTGRDVADAEIPVRFEGMTWRSAPASVSEASFERTEVYRVIEAVGPIFPKAIADRTGLERTSVQHMCSALADTGAVIRTAGGYVAATNTSDGPDPLYVPGHSTHSGSDGSDGGHARARAREEPIPVVIRPTEADAIPCKDYRAHQTRHRFIVDRWVCPVCSPIWAEAQA